jgi:hypothetical protein
MVQVFVNNACFFPKEDTIKYKHITYEQTLYVELTEEKNLRA